MERMIQEVLSGWRNTHRNDPETAIEQLSALAQFAAQQMESRELQVLRSMGSMLDAAVIGEDIDRQTSHLQAYNLGKAHAMIELINYFLLPCEREQTARTTVGREETVLWFIAKRTEVTPSQIMDGLHIENKQQVSNLLRSLRLKQLVSVVPSGKHRRYSLTAAGREVLAVKQASRPEDVVKKHNNAEKTIAYSHGTGVERLFQWAVTIKPIEEDSYHGVSIRGDKGMDNTSDVFPIPPYVMEESST